MKAFLLMLFLALTLSIADASYAIDTNDWENYYHIFPHAQNGDSPLEVAKSILGTTITDSKNVTVEADDTAKRVVVSFTRPWHDIEYFSVSVSSEGDGKLYKVLYFFNKGKLTLLDVLSRYGAEFCDVSTESDLSKKINVAVTKTTRSLPSHHPLSLFQTLIRREEVILLSATSVDKVNVDMLGFGYLVKNKYSK